MSYTAVDPYDHVKVGQGHHGAHTHVGGHHYQGGGHGHVYTTTYLPQTKYVHTGPYDTVYTEPHGVMAGGVVLLITGIALAALGILGCAFGDIPWGIGAIITGAIAGFVGSAMIAFDSW